MTIFPYRLPLPSDGDGTWSYRAWKKKEYPMKVGDYYRTLLGAKYLYIKILSIEPAKDKSCVYVRYKDSDGKLGQFLYGSATHKDLEPVSKLSGMVRIKDG